MISGIVLAVVALVIAVGLLILKTRAALVFLTLMAGTVLADALHEAVISALRSAVKPSEAMLSVVQIALLFLPAVLVAVLCRGSAARKLPLQMVPALLTGANAILLVSPLLPLAQQQTLASDQIFSAFLNYKLLIVLSGFAVAIAAIGLEHRHKEE